jgi:pilus assembly protein CpaE
MSDIRVIAVGTPPTFRQQVARALGAGIDEIEWMPSVTAVEGYLADEHLSAGVLVLSPAIKEPDAFGLADFVNRTTPSTAVIMVRDRVLNGLHSAAMRAGIRDVVDLSRGSEDLAEALRGALSWSSRLYSVTENSNGRVPGRRGTLLSVFSSKGGTGKSFLSCNLAAAIATQTGKDTALVDVDLEMGDVFAYYGSEPTRSFENLIAIGGRGDRQSIMDVGTPFLDHLWGYGSPSDPAATPVPGEAVGKVLRAIQGAFDYVIVDCPAAYSDHVLASFDLAEQIVLITGLDVVGVRHLSIALRTLLSLGLPREKFHVVLNRADSKVGLSPNGVERILNIRVDGMIPSSRLVPASLNKGRPVYLEEPKSEVTRAIASFASKLTAGAELARPAQQPRRGLFSKR